MSIRPNKEFGNINSYALTCDAGNKNHGEDVDVRTFDEATEQAKELGWRTIAVVDPKTGKKKWLNICPDCQKKDPKYFNPTPEIRNPAGEN